MPTDFGEERDHFAADDGPLGQCAPEDDEELGDEEFCEECGYLLDDCRCYIEPEDDDA